MKGKKKPLLIMIVLLLAMMTAMPSAAGSYTLEPSDYSFTKEYDSVTIPSYRINGDVYVPLTVFADAFGVTTAYDEKTESINLDFATADGADKRLHEMEQYVKNTSRSVGPTPHKLYVQGNAIDLPMLLVDGHNFVQIDVIAEGFGYRAVRNASSHTIGLTQDDFFQSPYLPRFETYLKENSIAVQTADTGELAGSDFDDYKVYLVGEQHAIAKNFDIQLYFIKYFNQHQNVRHIISEEGFCDTMLLNRYLETGDTSIIKNIMEGTKGSFAYSKEHYAFYEKVYAYNQTLPKDRRLTFLGIDVQHNAQVGFDYLLSLSGYSQKETAPVKAALEAIASRDEARVAEAAKLLAEHEADFRAYFGDQFTSFRFGLRSVEQGIKYYEARDYAVRENFIHENFRNYYETYGMEKCFGMFGGAHTRLNGSFGEVSNLAGYMNGEFEPTKGKVCSIMTNYNGCSYMDSATGKSIPVTYNESEALSRLLKQVANDDLVLYPLAGDGSPFVESGFTDFFQYYLSVKNSPATTPYGELKKQ